MKLRKLFVRRMPGFEEKGFELVDLSDGLNVITGPNASGKTTTCRAIQGLLWPVTLNKISPVSLVGEWVEKDELLRLELNDSISTCQRDGIPGEMPSLPEPHVADCFTVTLDDLFEGSKTDVDMAERVAREMAGGYDLKAIRELDVLKISRTRGRKEFSEYENTKKEVGRITTEQQSLRADEEELSALESKEKEARAAQTRLSILAEVENLIAVRDKIGHTVTVLEEFPEGMELLRGNEGENLSQIREDLANAHEELEQAFAATEAATQQMANAELPDGGIAEVRLEEQKTQVDNLRRIEQSLCDTKRREREATAKVESALRAFGDIAEPEKLDAIDTSALGDIEVYYRDTEDTQSRRSALQAKLALLGEKTQPADTDALINGINILRQWFEAGTAESGPQQKLFALTCILVVSFAIVGVALALSVNAWWALLLLPAGIAAVAVWLLRKPREVATRIILQEQYIRLSLAAPASWDREVVGKHLNTLERELAKAREAEHNNSQREDIEGQLKKLKEKSDTLAGRQSELVARFGISPEISPLALYVFATNLLRYQEGQLAVDICNREISELQENHARQLKAINPFLVEFGEEPCDSYEIAHVRIGNIEKREERHRQARDQLIVAHQNAKSAQKWLDELQERKGQAFDQLALADNDDASLQEKLAALSDYQEVTKELSVLKADERALLNRLEHTPEMVALTLEQITEDKHRLQKMADDHDSVFNRILGIRSRIESVTQNMTLEDALVKLESAKEELAERCNEALLAAAGNYLLDEVEAEYEVESRPAVLLKASKWLGMFTRGRYELRLGEQEQSGVPEFRALATIAGRGLALHELSRGTRMQLLLATRLAFATAAERGTELPFILDEVLSSSDPVRFRAIISCMLAMVKEGRQVIYLTCQPSDSVAWHEMAEEMGIGDACRIDMADVRRGEHITAQPLTTSAIQTDRLPDPVGMSLSEYAETIGVPALDPSAGASAAHVAHLLEDAEQLRRLLVAGIETYGQLDSLASHDKIDAYVRDDALKRMQARACVLDSFAKAWRIGRGRPVSRLVLADAGVSANYIDRVTDLASDLNWDAKRLIEALRARDDERARGFRSNALETLTENLTDSGHLATENPLNEEDVLARILAVSNDSIKQEIIDAHEVRALCSMLWNLVETEEGIENRSD